MKTHKFQMPALFTDHMVLQSGHPVPVWGTGVPGAAVKVVFGSYEAAGTVGEDGRWQVSLPALPANESGILRIVCADVVREITDVVSGEVWLCSGQSNMDWLMSQLNHGLEDIQASANSSIRLFHVPQVASPELCHDVECQWEVCTPETVSHFSAVGYYFGQEIQNKLGVPVGLIQAAWGGTPAEAWTPWEDLVAGKEFTDLVNSYRILLDPSLPEAERFVEDYNRWQKVKEYQDPGNRAYFKGWADLDFDDTGWREMVVPGYWQTQQLAVNGAVWYRLKIVVPADWADQDLMLELGAIDDLDTTYFNGTEIGSTGKETEKWWEHRRIYRVPADLVQPGAVNVVAVRIFDLTGFGGFVGTGPRHLRLADGDCVPVVVEGVWKAEVEYGFEIELPKKAEPFRSFAGPGSHLAPASLFNGMIHPLAPYGIRGVIWYQGESNEGREEQYSVLFPAMIKAWRRQFANPQMSFLFVLLAGWRQKQVAPMQSDWTMLRHAQMQALHLPQTGCASAIDLGDESDIHPQQKKPVGHRLSLVARAVAYKEEIAYHGPLMERWVVEGRTVRLFFKHADGGLKPAGGDLKGFGIYQKELGWKWAEARIEDNTVVLSSAGVSEPTGACYGWAGYPIGNLTNGADLPAFPFCTDYSL